MHIYTNAYAYAGLMMMIVILIIADWHMLETARVCELRVYVYLVDGLYRRAELSKHPHCIRVPARARQQQRCQTVFLPHSQVITGQRSSGLDEREHAHEYIHTCQYMHIYTHTQTSPMCVDTLKKKEDINTYEHACSIYMRLYAC
jgi:hypothetical protein